MKNMYKLTLLFLLLSFAGFSQNAFRKVSEKLDTKTNFSATSLSKKTIKLYLKEKNPNTETRAVLENIDELNILSFNEATPSFFEKVASIYPLSEYSLFQFDQNPQNQKKIYLKENGDIISDLLIMESSASHSSLVELKGNIDMEKIALLNQVLRIDGLNSLDNIGAKSIAGKASTKETNIKIGQPITFKSPTLGYNHQFDVQNFTPNSNITGYGQQFSTTDQSEKSNKQNTNSSVYYGNRAPTDGFKTWYVDDMNGKNGLMVPKSQGVKVFDKYGNMMMNVDRDPTVIVNGYISSSDLNTSLKHLNPNCIQSINVLKDQEAASTYGNKNGVIDIKLRGNCNAPYTVCEGVLYFGQNGLLNSIPLNDDCSPKLLVDCIEKPLPDIESIEIDKIKTIELTTNPINCSGVHDGEFIVIQSK